MFPRGCGSILPGRSRIESIGFHKEVGVLPLRFLFRFSFTSLNAVPWRTSQFRTFGPARSLRDSVGSSCVWRSSCAHLLLMDGRGGYVEHLAMKNNIRTCIL